MVKKQPKKRGIAIILTAKEPFDDRCEKVVDLMEQFICMVQKTHPDVIEEQKVWVLPESEPAFHSEDLYSSEQWNELKRKVLLNPYAFGFRDYDSVRKGNRFQGVDVEFQTTMYPYEKGHRHQHAWGYHLSLFMRYDIYEAIVPLGFLSLVNELAQTIRAGNGASDWFWMHSKMIQLSALPLGELRQQFDSFSPGYPWRLLLTKRHIQILGGMEKIKQQAPCACVEELTIDGEPAAWLQVTEEPFTDTHAVRLAWKKYLWPLLPPTDYAKLAHELTRYREPVTELVLTEEEEQTIDELLALPREELSRRFQENRNQREMKDEALASGGESQVSKPEKMAAECVQQASQSGGQPSGRIEADAQEADSAEEIPWVFSADATYVIAKCLQAMMALFASDAADEDDEEEYAEEKETRALLEEALEKVTSHGNVYSADELHAIVLSLHFWNGPEGNIADTEEPRMIGLADRLMEDITNELLKRGAL